MGTNPRDIKLDDEFSALNRELTDAEYSMLEGSIAVDGIREPLVVWDEQGILIDGHNRRDVCINLNRDIPDDKIERKSFGSREEALLWAIKYQCGRRNLTPQEMSELRGKRYRAEKKKIGGDGTNQHSREEWRQNDAIANESKRTREALATEYGVSPKTIERDEKFADALAAMPNEERQKVLRGDGPSKKELIGKQSSPKAANPPKQQKSKIGPPCVGMQFARIAIMNLKEIAPDDAERAVALESVAKWIEENK